MTPKSAEVLQMSPKPENTGGIEIIDAVELARRMVLPESWVRQHVTARYPREERIPCLRLGRYVRFRWGSSELNAWLKSLETR